MTLDQFIDTLKSAQAEAGDVRVLTYSDGIFNGIGSVQLSESEESVIISLDLDDEVEEEDV